MYTWRCPFLLRFDSHKWDLTQNIYALLSRIGINRKYAISWSPFLLRFDSDKRDSAQTWLRLWVKKRRVKPLVPLGLFLVTAHQGSMTGLRTLYWCSGGKGAKVSPTNTTHANAEVSIWRVSEITLVTIFLWFQFRDHEKQVWQGIVGQWIHRQVWKYSRNSLAKQPDETTQQHGVYYLTL